LGGLGGRESYHHILSPKKPREKKNWWGRFCLYTSTGKEETSSNEYKQSYGRKRFTYCKKKIENAGTSTGIFPGWREAREGK